MKIGVILLLCLAWSCPILAQTLERDAVWRGELRFTETVRVPPDVSLTLAPGTRVRFDSGGLEVAGRLLAEQSEFSGEFWDGLVLKNCDASTRLSRVTIRGAKIGLLVQGGAPQLEQVTLQDNQIGAEWRGQAAGTLKDCRILENAKVGLFIKDESRPRVTGCQFRNNGRYGAYIYRSRPAVFTGNRFDQNGTGLMIAYHGTDPLVENNLFVDNDTGIQVDRAARPKLYSNQLRGNRTGIHLYRRSDPDIRANLLADNQVGILVAYSSYPTIAGNDFVANPVAIRLEYQSSVWEQAKGPAARSDELAGQGAFTGQGTRKVGEEQRQARSLDGRIEASGNWWGQAGTTELVAPSFTGNPSFIHDGRDQPTFSEAGRDYPLDHVRFSPWSRSRLTEFEP